MQAYNLATEVSQSSNTGRLGVVMAVGPNQRPSGRGFREVLTGHTYSSLWRCRHPVHRVNSFVVVVYIVDELVDGHTPPRFIYVETFW